MSSCRNFPRVKFGEEARYLIEIQPHWIEGMGHMIGRWPWLSARLIRAVVWTSNGQMFKVRPSSNIVAKIVEAKKRKPA